MLTESLLAYLHISAIFAMIVFMSSQAALCRSEWLNDLAVRRLVRLDQIYLVATLGVLLTGVARTIWGMKGVAWYWHQPLLHIMLTLYVLMVLMSIPSSRAFLRWRGQVDAGQGLPLPDEVSRMRRLIMVKAHVMMFVPLAATLLARGVWTV